MLSVVETLLTADVAARWLADVAKAGLAVLLADVAVMGELLALLVADVALLAADVAARWLADVAKAGLAVLLAEVAVLGELAGVAMFSRL
jgi:hypothetical protein